jgi:hypothetical protein
MEREQPVQPGRTTGNSNLSSLDMFKVATIVQQIKTGLNEAAQSRCIQCKRHYKAAL